MLTVLYIEFSVYINWFPCSPVSQQFNTTHLVFYLPSAYTFFLTTTYLYYFQMSNDKLRFITYLSPGVPVQLFDTVMQYLEEVTGKQSYLIHESRWSGPPLDREDPFTADDVDIGTKNYVH